MRRTRGWRAVGLPMNGLVVACHSPSARSPAAMRTRGPGPLPFRWVARLVSLLLLASCGKPSTGGDVPRDSGPHVDTAEDRDTSPADDTGGDDGFVDGTDISARLQERIDVLGAAGGGRIALPAGTFLVSSPITLKSRVWIEGEGEATVLQTVAGSLEGPDAALFHSRGVMLEGASVRRLHVEGGATPGLTALYLEDARFNLFDDISVSGLSDGTLYVGYPLGGSNDSLGSNINNYANIFSDMSMDEGRYGLILHGLQDPASADPLPSSVITLNSYRAITLSSISGIGVQSVSWSDSENFDTLRISVREPDAIGLDLRDAGNLPGQYVGAANYQFAWTTIDAASPMDVIGVRFAPLTGGFSFLGLSLGEGVQFDDSGTQSYFAAGTFAVPTAAGTCDGLEARAAPADELRIGPPAEGGASELIQESIDALASGGGGVLRLTAGDYLVDRPIELASDVWIEGDGFATVLVPSSAVEAVFKNSGSLSRASISDLAVDGSTEPTTWAFSLSNPQEVLVANIFGTRLISGGAVRIRTTEASSGNCFQNILFDELRGGIMVNDNADAPAEATFSASEFRSIKFLHVEELGIGVLRRTADSLFSDLVIWNGQGAATAILVGSPYQVEGDPDLPGRSVTGLTFYNVTETMEGGGAAHIYGNSASGADSEESIGVRFSDTSGHALLGVFYTTWYWKNPVIATGSDNLTIATNVSEVLRGSSEWWTAYEFPMSGLYEYKCTTLCSHPLGDVTSKGVVNFGEAGLAYMP
jgi:hypothetical protein